MNNLPEWARREYNLVPHRREGARRLACQDIFNLLDEGGSVVHREARSATLTVETRGGSPDGRPVLRWTYDSFRIETSGAGGAPADGLPEGGSLTFEGVPEDDASYFPPVGSLGLDTTSASAWLTAELVIHTRAFDIMATRTHGGIDRLRRIGDRTVMPWSRTRAHVQFGEMIDAEISRAESVLCFDGVGIKAHRPAAVLSCVTPYDLTAAGLGPTHIDLVGKLWIDLETGEVLAGCARQANYIASAPRSDGTAAPMNHLFETFVEVIPET